MRNIGKIIVIGLVLLGNLYGKEIIFDLRAQDFANSLHGKMITSKYKVNDTVIVKTNLLKASKGDFYYNHDHSKHGFFNFIVNNLNLNWKLSLDIKYVYYYKTETKKHIKFIDEYGENILLEFTKKGFTLNGKQYKADINKEKMLLEIININNKLSIRMNGQNIYKHKINLAKLKYIDIDIYEEELYGILLISYE